MTNGTLIDRLSDEILQFTRKYLQLCHHFSAVSQGPITEAMVHFKRFQLLRKKEASFISPSAAAMLICGDKAIVSYKHRTLRNALQQHLITSSTALAAFHSWCINVWFQVHKAPMIGYSLCSASLHCLLNLFLLSSITGWSLPAALPARSTIFCRLSAKYYSPFFWVLVFLYAISIYSMNHSLFHSMLWVMCHCKCWLTYTTVLISILFWFHLLIIKKSLSLHPLHMCIYLVITLLVLLYMHCCTNILCILLNTTTI